MFEYCQFCHKYEDANYPQLAESLRPHRSMKCPECGRDIVLVDFATACDCVQRSRSTIYSWIETGRISTVHVAGGPKLIIHSSLFLPNDAPTRDRDRFRGNPRRLRNSVR